ncbi:MAG: TolC family protein [Bacteroidota bacterium]|nr:TolC family protein [Bacteroidota bacterium]
MVSLRRNSLILLLIGLGGICLSQTSSVFSYNTFLNSVKEANPLSKRAENNNAYGKAKLRAAQGNFDPQLGSNIESKQFNSSNYFTYGNAELKQPLYTSQYLKVGYQYGQGMYLNPELSTPLIGLPYVGIEASLLQGLMFDKRRAEVVKAKHYSEYFNAEQKIQMNDLLFSASNVYVDALYTKKINSLFSYFSTLAQQRLNGISELSVVGERPAIDTIEAAIFLQSRLLDRQAGEIEMIKKLNELTIINPLSSTLSLSNTNLTDSLEQVYSLTIKTIQQTIINEQNTNPFISQYLAKQKVLETEKRLKREMIKPVLDVSYNFLNTSNDIIFPTLNTNNYKWGANFSFPLFLRKPRNEYKMAALDAKNNELETINKQNQINFKRKYILEAIQLTAGQIVNAQRSAEYSKLLVEAEKLKFANGESSLFLLNSRESKWLETELKLAEYKLKFIKSFIELTYVNGDLKYEL